MSATNEDLNDNEKIYKEYLCPNGEVAKLTKSEFDTIVEWFLWLDDQQRKRDGLPSMVIDSNPGSLSTPK